MKHLSMPTIYSYVSGDLSPPGRWRVERHAARCARCRRTLNSSKTSAAVVKALRT